MFAVKCLNCFIVELTSMAKLVLIQILLSYFSLYLAYTDKFEDFIKNKDAKNLVEQYKSGEIKTITNLHEQITRKGIKISRRSLDNYLKKMKVSVICWQQDISRTFSNYLKHNVRPRNGSNVVFEQTPSSRSIRYLVLL